MQDIHDHERVIRHAQDARMHCACSRLHAWQLDLRPAGIALTFQSRGPCFADPSHTDLLNEAVVRQIDVTVPTEQRERLREFHEGFQQAGATARRQHKRIAFLGTHAHQPPLDRKTRKAARV